MISKHEYCSSNYQIIYAIFYEIIQSCIVRFDKRWHFITIQNRTENYFVYNNDSFQCHHNIVEYRKLTLKIGYSYNLLKFRAKLTKLIIIVEMDCIYTKNIGYILRNTIIYHVFVIKSCFIISYNLPNQKCSIVCPKTF